MFAAQNGQTATVEALLSRGARIEAKEEVRHRFSICSSRMALEIGAMRGASAKVLYRRRPPCSTVRW